MDARSLNDRGSAACSGSALVTPGGMGRSGRGGGTLAAGGQSRKSGSPRGSRGEFRCSRSRGAPDGRERKLHKGFGRILKWSQVPNGVLNFANKDNMKWPLRAENSEAA